jgi:hypothetical protein
LIDYEIFNLCVALKKHRMVVLATILEGIFDSFLEVFATIIVQSDLAKRDTTGKKIFR